MVQTCIDLAYVQGQILKDIIENLQLPRTDKDIICVKNKCFKTPTKSIVDNCCRARTFLTKVIKGNNHTPNSVEPHKSLHKVFQMPNM